MMKKVALFFLSVMIAGLSFGQVSGIYSIPGTNFPTISSAIDSLNSFGVGFGGVTFNVAAGHSETFTELNSGLITATGAADSPIIFQKSGSGANPVITAPPTGIDNYDYVICLSGTDYVTFDGINIQENPLNITAPQVMDRGYAILKASAGDGAQHVTIKNCKIVLSNINTASYGIYAENVTVAAPATQLTIAAANGTNSYLKIYNDTISGASNGIYLSGYTDPTAPYAYYDQNNEIGKDGPNLITNLGSTTGTCYGINVQYQNNLYIRQNQINGTVATAFYGINTGPGNNSTLDISSNQLNIQFTGTTTNFCGINNSMGGTGTTNTVNIFSNTVSGNNLPNISTGSFYGINNTASCFNLNCYSNFVSENAMGSSIALATGTFNGIYLAGGNSTTGSTWNIYNNSILSNQRIQSSTGNGPSNYLYLGASGKIANIHNNVIDHNNSASYGECTLLYFANSQATGDVYGNQLTRQVTGGGKIYGFYARSFLTLNFHENTITDLFSNGPPVLSFPVYVYGIYFASSSVNATLYNNVVGDFRGPQASIDPSIYAIFANSILSCKLYNNTLYLDATSTGTNFGTNLLFFNSNVVLELRNNILINKSIANGYGHNYLLMRSYGMGTMSMNNNNNNLYITPGVNNLFYTDQAGTNASSIQDFRGIMYPRETLSFSENTTFMNSTVHPYDLHLDAVYLTQCESGGATISSPVNIVTDIDNEPRFPNAGYPSNAGFQPIAPDVGSDEIGAKVTDIIPPVIVCTALQNTSSTTFRTIHATITDISGIPQTAGELPRLYWKKNKAGTWNAVTSVSMGNNDYTFSFGNGTSIGDTVFYYLAAQDNAPNINVSGFPIIGTTGFTASPPYCLPPAAPMSYRVIGSVSGIIPVGAGQTYTTLTNAINDINSKELVGSVVLELNDNDYPSEIFPITINPAVGLSAVNTLTIRPLAGMTPVITGTSTTGILKINGADFIIVDGSNAGSTDRSLTWENKSTANNSFTIGFYNYNGDPAKNCILKNCVVKSKPEITNATIAVSFDLNNGDYDNMVIDNNLIKSARFGIWLRGTSTGIANRGQIINNTIGSVVPGEGITYRGISIFNVDSTLIQNNEIFGDPAGNANSGQAGIYVFAGSTRTQIKRNMIHDWYYTGTADAGNFGIYYAGDATTVTEIFNNIFYNIKSESKPISIAFGTGGNAKVYHNTMFIGSGFMSATRATYSTCININSGIVSLDIQNNIFKNSATPISTNTTLNAYAIYNQSSASVFSAIDHNDYFVDGTNPYIGYQGSAQQTLANWQAVSLQDVHSVSTDPLFTGANNLIPTSGGVNNAGVYLSAVPTDFAGTPRMDPPDMGAYEIEVAPRLITNVAVDITGTSAVLNGTANANNNPSLTTSFEYGLSTEYGSEVPSIPASVSGFPGIAISTSVASLIPNTTYHFRSKGVNSDSVYYGNDISFTTLAVLPIPVTGNASAISSISAQLNGTVTANNSATTVMFEYGTTEAYGSTAIGTPDLVNGMAAAPISSTVTGLIANTLYHYRVVATNQSGTAYGADQSFLTSQEIPATISLTGIITGDTCFNAIDTILVAGTPNTFIVSPTGNVTLIAGASIRLLPGAKVDLGGYLYAYITTTETYCFNPRKSIADAMTGNVGAQVSNPISGTDRTLKIWPNPASDYFFINLTSGQAPIPSTIEIFTAAGTRVAQTKTYDAVTSVSVNFLKSGIYFVKVTSGYGTATAKLVKM